MQRSADAATSFTSPLAQIFTPLVVDDDIVEEQTQLNQPPSLVSYGPVSRRRLSSMHRFPPMAPMDVQRRLNMSQNTVQESPGSAGTVQEEPELESDPLPQPESASQALDEEETGEGAFPQLSARLRSIEERQKRIEELILQLAQELKSQKG